MISNSKIKANNGSVTDAAGSAPPNGSNETVTLCRFAIAKAMMMTASGTRTTAATILFSKLDLRRPNRADQARLVV